MKTAYTKHQIGIYGLGVMGRNLALNISRQGITVAGFERDSSLRKYAKRFSSEFYTYDSEKEFIDSLQIPRTIIIIITSGPPVDQSINTLLPYLSSNDLLIDAGNSDYRDTEKREIRLSDLSISFLGVGISGGALGARLGPALMVGGTDFACQRIDNLFSNISAKLSDGTPCFKQLGRHASIGHFVKMVHNGIEYADMQLIAEVYDIFSRGFGMPAGKISDLFSSWSNSDLSSFLIEKTAAILAQKDNDSHSPLVDLILDKAEQNGTGRLAGITAIELGVPAPTIVEAVTARAISSLKFERINASKFYGFSKEINSDVSSHVIHNALLAAKICTYAQGFSILSAASNKYQWDLPLGEVATIWRGGCIIRAKLLESISQAYNAQPSLSNLIIDQHFVEIFKSIIPSLRSVIIQATNAGIPIPGLASSLAYFDSYTSHRLPANLIQAQRDLFGSHGFERINRTGTFHHNWQIAE